MNTSLKKLFSATDSRPAPEGLFEKILLRIEARERMRALWRFSICSATAVLSAILMVPALNALHSAMTQSGSYHYFSLALSNFSEVASSWQDYAFSILESLPVFSIALFLGAMFFLLAALRFIGRDAKTLFLRHF